MQHIEMTPGIRLKTNRGILLDRRRSLTKPNYIGLIIPNLEGPGYTFCPFVFQRLRFKKLPPIFNTPRSAANWIENQKPVYLTDHYTIFNKLIWWIYLLPISMKVFMHVRFGVLSILVPAFFLTLFAKPADPVMFVMTKLCAIVCGLRSIFEAHLLRKEMKTRVNTCPTCQKAVTGQSSHTHPIPKERT